MIEYGSWPMFDYGTYTARIRADESHFNIMKEHFRVEARNPLKHGKTDKCWLWIRHGYIGDERLIGYTGYLYFRKFSEEELVKVWGLLCL